MNGRQTSWWTAVVVVFDFELRRAITVPRMAWWCVLAFFPVAIVSLVLMIPRSSQNVTVEMWATFLYILIPLLISMLGTFMWTASAISAELEQQSWIYLAVRPGGRVAVLLGKYAVAVSWVLPATLVGVTLSVIIVWLAGSSLAASGACLRTWFAIVRLSCLAVPAYAAIYLAIGAIFTKRAMVISVAYTLVFELIVSFVPALINKFTIQYRLRALFVEWADIDLNQMGELGSVDLFGNEPAWLHLTVLATYALALVITATWLVRKREYLVTVSADVS